MKGIYYSKPATWLKRNIGKLILTDFTGNIIRKVLNNKIPYRNSIIQTNFPQVNGSTIASLYLGSYESGEARFINKYLRTDLPVLELGSSIGVVSTQIGKKTNQKLFLLEVNTDLIPIIETNLSHNNITNYELVNSAISYNQDAIYFVRGHKNTTGKVTSEPQPGAIKIEGFTLESVLKQFNVNGKYVLVCDIEGMELEIIKNDEKSLNNCSQLIIELHETSLNGHRYSADNLKKMLLKQGFELIDSHGNNHVFHRN